MEKSCSNCGYVEKANGKRKDPEMFCSNGKSQHCSEWVTDEDICPRWIRYTAVTKYYNITG